MVVSRAGEVGAQEESGRTAVTLHRPVLTWSSSRSANLSDSYFTNRQDRYVFLQDCPEVADFFTELVDAVGDVSLQLQGDDTVNVLEGMVHPYKGRALGCTTRPSVWVGGLATGCGDGWQSLILLLLLQPDGGDSLAIREGVSPGRWARGLWACSSGVSLEPGRSYRKQPAQRRPCSGLDSCHSRVWLCGAAPLRSVASGLESERRSQQLCLLEIDRPRGGICIPAIPVVVTSRTLRRSAAEFAPASAVWGRG